MGGRFLGAVRAVARELRFNVKRSRRGFPFDLAVLALCCAAFYGNELVLKDALGEAAAGSAFEYLAYCQLNDFLGGIAFLAYTNLLLDAVRPDMRVRRLATCVAYIFACGLFWEYVAPLFVAGSTADPLDLVAYLCGGATYWLLNRLIAGKAPIASGAG